jgi:hypothetical protein
MTAATIALTLGAIFAAVGFGMSVLRLVATRQKPRLSF